MHKVSLLFLLIFLLHTIGPAAGATIHGTIYEWYTLEPLQDVILEVNSTPPQRFVAKEGTYVFELERGQYCIKSRYYEGGGLLYHLEENMSIEADGDFVLDLIMFPDINLSEKFFGDLDVDFDIDKSLPEDADIDGGGELLYWVIAVSVIVLLAFLYFLRSGRRTEKALREPLPEDLIEVEGILKKHGGRMTQLELREELNYSEAKISLMLADLENRGIIEKFKKGRGNIIILKK